MRVRVGLLVVAAVAGSADVALRAASIAIPIADARPIVEALRGDLVPPELRGLPGDQLATRWPVWVARRYADIRARLDAGDEDSIANLTLFGTSFTAEPRVTELQISDMAAGKPAPPALARRVDAMAAAAAAPGANERVQFVRDVARRHGLDPGTADGRDRLRAWLADRVTRVVADYRTRAAAIYAPAATPIDDATAFRNRGLSSDTTIFPGFAIEQTLDALKSNALLAPRAVRRVAIAGPGLDFTDKEEGFDFYAPQTIQPFATIDSLLRLGLSAPGVQVTTLDVSPRVNGHLESAIARARGGAGYVVQLPRDARFTWTPFLATYWQRLGDRIGASAVAVSPPVGGGAIQVRAVRVRPEVVRAITPLDLNIVLQRIEPLAPGQRFDLIVATNILLYYDVFEQSLALSNVAAMLRPGGFLLTNTQIAVLPSIPMELVGYTDVGYTDRPEGDRVFWYRRN